MNPKPVPGQELTPEEAAGLLGVSQPFLDGLLTAREIEYRMVGTDRRVLADSLMHYLREDDRRRRAAADELTVLSADLGLI